MDTHNRSDTAAVVTATDDQGRAIGVQAQIPLRARIALILIMLLAVGLRLAMFVVGPSADLSRAYEPDSRRYVELATNLEEYGVFGRAAENSGVVHIPLAKLRAARGELEAADEHGLRLEVFRTPGYPLFIAVFQRLGVGLRGTLIVQAMLGALSVLAVYALGLRLFGRIWVALLAGLILAVHPAAIVASTSVLSETLFACMVLIGLWLVVRQKRPLLITVGGLIIGLAVLVRPVGILLGLAVVLWMIATQRRWKVIAPAVCLMIASLLPAACWMARLGVPYQPTGLRERLLKGDWSFKDVPDRTGL